MNSIQKEYTYEIFTDFGDFRTLTGAVLIPHAIAKLDQLLQELGV